MSDIQKAIDIIQRIQDCYLYQECDMDCIHCKHSIGVMEVSHTCNAAIAALQEKQHNDDLRKRGRLVELPCDIGARVYKVYQFCGAGAWEIEAHKIKLEDLPEIGKTIFLTRKDAQDVVEKMEQKRSLLEAQDD